MKRKPMNDSYSKKVFRNGDTVKETNLRPHPMRGGFRL